MQGCRVIGSSKINDITFIFISIRLNLDRAVREGRLLKDKDEYVMRFGGLERLFEKE